MYHSILVPLDGSRRSEQALIPAATIARLTDAQLRIVRIDEGALFPVDVAGWPSGGAVERDHETYMRRVVDRVREQSGVHARWALLRGAVVPVLLEHARDVRADLVVMATHGRGGVERAWLGSVADEMVRAGALPILLTRLDEHLEQAPVTWSPRRVLVPLDGSPLAESALPHAFAIAAAAGARVRLARVIPLPLPAQADYAEPSAEDLERSCAWPRRYLQGVIERALDDCDLDTAVVAATRPAYGLLSEAASWRADLLVMATHGYGGLRRFVLGSVADKVVRGAAVPVLVVPPASAPDRDETGRSQRHEAAAGTPALSAV
jgi:nucleotide-binding universal stress UspA family protein